MERMKHWLNSKTVWFNIILTVIGIAVILDQYIPAQYAAISIITQGIGNLVLRIWFTSQPIGTEPKDAPVEHFTDDRSW